MIDQEEFYKLMKDGGIEFITGVPDSLLNDFCSYVQTNLSSKNHVIAANEGNAIALAAGYHLSTGTVPLVYMQNSGLGNAINPLTSLVNDEVYGIPMILLVGWRGSPDVNDWAQHKLPGHLTPKLLECMNIPFLTLEDNSSSFESLKWAIETAREKKSPVALLAKKGVLAKEKKEQPLPGESEYTMNREEAIKCVIDNTPEDTVFVATTGRATRELHELRKASGGSHRFDFLNVGAMGHTSSIATGLALGSKNRLVVCLDGDASTIMHLGALITAGIIEQLKLLHIVLNNGAHESVGGQPSAGHKIDLTSIAGIVGYKTIGKSANSEEELASAIKELLRNDDAGFIDVRIRKGARGDLPSLKVNLKESKDAFMSAIKG
ncbi:phosphonopyruvate decarboxylase [uncultured Mesotoga sp.]|uniref:phosphonopyruvate decarboxylase n=1 Tax=uncultured Mesotoga sp. TaxID=1184400 RepID=UPI002599D03A|nr:phosphonopyruvate decarboxylase [uncultured Mesotoga sp.]